VAIPLFVMGGGVKPGLHGFYTGLNDFQEGDLKIHADFRSFNATEREEWLGAHSEKVAGRSFSTLLFI
jgi:uncharacterized protein (DUF1501 family)